MEQDDPVLKTCSRVDYRQIDISGDYPKNAVAYDCSKNHPSAARFM